MRYWLVGTLWLGMALGAIAWSPAAEAKKAPVEKKPAAGAPAKDSSEEYELMRILVDAFDQVDRNYVKSVDRRELIEAAISGMLSKLDPYSSYISPRDLSQFRSSVDNEFGGIGIQLNGDANQLKVLSPLVGTPAYRAGIIAGDRILSINGRSAAEMNRDEAIRQMKGEPGSKVTLTVQHPTESKPETITLTRELIHLDTVLGFRRGTGDRWDFFVDREKRLGYIRLSAFSRDTARELRTALEEVMAAKAKGLILDLRFNPGGLLNASIEVAELFIPKGKRIVSTAGRNSPGRVWDAVSNDPFEELPLVVLVNRYSASAAEIVSACLQDHHRAVIVGERTWGKGSVQNVIELEGGQSMLKLTTAGYCRPSGKNIDRFSAPKGSQQWGVSPDPGFDLRLDDQEMASLIEDRRQRDIVNPRPKAATPAASTKLVSQTTQAPKKSEPKPPSTEQKPASSQPGAEKVKSSSPATKPSPGSTVKPPASPAAKPPASPAAKPSGTPAAKPTTKTVAKVQGGSPPAKKPFVDRQLQKALEYLNGELAKADRASSEVR